MLGFKFSGQIIFNSHEILSSFPIREYADIFPAPDPIPSFTYEIINRVPQNGGYQMKCSSQSVVRKVQLFHNHQCSVGFQVDVIIRRYTNDAVTTCHSIQSALNLWTQVYGLQRDKLDTVSFRHPVYDKVYPALAEQAHAII